MFRAPTTSLLFLSLALCACGQDSLHSISSIGDIRVDGITISAPLFPIYEVTYELEAPNYPDDPEAVSAWLEERQGIYSFEEMLEHCSTIPPYSQEILLPNETELSPEEIAANYNAVASCSYDREAGFGSKPYWIPQMVQDVDICATELGADWSLMTEDFVLSRTPEFFEQIASTHTTEDRGDDHASFYFSLAVYVQGSDGQLKVATLEPGTPDPARVRALPEGIDYETHIEQPFREETTGSWYDQTIVLRCVRL